MSEEFYPPRLWNRAESEQIKFHSRRLTYGIEALLTVVMRQEHWRDGLADRHDIANVGSAESDWHADAVALIDDENRLHQEHVSHASATPVVDQTRSLPHSMISLPQHSNPSMIALHVPQPSSTFIASYHERLIADWFLEHASRHFEVERK